MTAGSPSRRIHVERTDDPAVLRWVPHHRLLDEASSGGRRVPEGSALGGLVHDGSIVDVSVRDGTVLVRAGAPQEWRQLAPRVQAALIAELDGLDALKASRQAAHWLLESFPVADRPPSVAELQQIVDRAAGSVMAGHGGAITVAAIDGDTVRLTAGGACTGCRRSDDTLFGLIEPAVRDASPGINRVTLDAAEPTPSPAPRDKPRRVPLSTRLGGLGRQAGGSCH